MPKYFKRKNTYKITYNATIRPNLDKSKFTTKKCSCNNCKITFTAKYAKRY